MARENAKKSFRLSRKQFIIILAAVCGIALIIEGSLLIRMFAKKRKSPNAEEKKPALAGVVEPEKGRTAESYIRREYQTYEGSEPKLEFIKQVEYDDEGRLCHKYLWEDIFYRGDPYEKQSSSEVFYSYDEKGRILRENWVWKDYYPTTDTAEESKEQISYEYKEEPSPEVLILVADGDGNLKSWTIEKYNENGIRTALTKYEVHDGNEIKTEDKTFNERGDVISEVLVYLDDDGKIDWKEKHEFSYYESGVSKTLSVEAYDANNLMYRLRTSHYNEYGLEISQDVFNRDGLKHVIVYDENERKSTNEDGKKTYFDEQGRTIREELDMDSRFLEYDFFYNKDGKAAVRMTRREQSKRSGKESRVEEVYDSKGRILQKIEIDVDGKETKTTYNWSYTDIRIPGVDVLQEQSFENGKRIEESLYLIKPVVNVEELHTWERSYATFAVWGCNHKYHGEQDVRGRYVAFTGGDYVSPYGQYHLEPIYKEVFKKKSGTWSTVTEATFYPNGMLKNVRSLEDGYNWDFDSRGNLIKTEKRDKNGALEEENIFEYTYYKGVSGETPEP